MFNAGMVNESAVRFEKVRPEPLHVQVLSQIRGMILSGKAAPGQTLAETELAAQLGVSRGPIRDALKVLERERLVVSNPRRRAHVATLNAKDAEEIYSLRRSLELLASQRAIENATQTDLDEMEDVLGRMQRALDENDFIAMSHLDAAFHDVIYRASDHNRLYQLWQEIRAQVTFFLVSREASPITSQSIMIDEHRALLEALADRDADRLLALTEEHLLGAYDRILQALPEEERD